MGKRSSTRTFLFSIIATGLGLLFSFVLLELVAAKFLLSDMETIGKEFNPELGWRYVPGTYKIKPQNSLIPYHIHINEFGLRSNDTPYISGDEVTRIIILGDSFTFAKACHQKDTFVSRLENRLNQQLQGRYETVNAGVEGYGTAQQLLLMKRLARKNLVGDIYVLQIFTNDILDNLRLEYSSKSIAPSKPGYILDSEHKLTLEHIPLKEKSLHHSGESNSSTLKVFQVARNILEMHLQSYPGLVKLATDLGMHVDFPRMPGVINGWYDNDVLERGIPLMKELIREIKSEVQKQNAKLLVMFIPSPLMIYPHTYGPLLKKTFQNSPQVDKFLSDTTKSQRIVKEICKEIDVPLLDMYPILLANNNRALFYPSEGHLTSDGHSVVANFLAEELINGYLH